MTGRGARRQEEHVNHGARDRACEVGVAVGCGRGLVGDDGTWAISQVAMANGDTHGKGGERRE